MDRRRCWFSPMRPVTPFMTMPTLWMICSLMEVWGLRFRFLGALRARSGGKRRDIKSGARQRAVQFLAPVRHVAGGSIAIDHAQRCVADVGQLVKHCGGDVDRLARVQR